MEINEYVINDSLLLSFSMISLFAAKKPTKTKQAHFHLINGICFRCTMIKESYRLLIEGINSLKYEESKLIEVNILINSFYINIRGIIDNLSWYLKYEYEIDVKSETQISITNKVFREKLYKNNFNIEKLYNFDEWFLELKKKRDPIAHRLPLYIPYKIVIGEENANNAQQLYKKANDKLVEGDQKWGASLFEARNVGEFFPVILNTDAATGRITIYPIENNIENDLKKVKELVVEILQ